MTFNTELETRLVFLDTSAYENKNYQFGQYALGRLQELIEQEKIHLLITDVTISEIELHLYKKSFSAAAKIKEITRDAMFLRNTPELDCYGIFTKVDGSEIYSLVHKKFLEFLDHRSIETISVSSVDPKLIFNAYFKNLPPFNKVSKKHEFPDAFALEAVKNISIERGHSVYIVSSDGDMQSYCDKEPNFLHLRSVDDLIDLTMRSDKAYEEPTRFADEVFELLEDEIKALAVNYLEDGEFIYEDADPYDEVINSVDIDSLTIGNKTLQDVNAEYAEYIVDFEVIVTADYRFSDYDRSPWDPEDKQYLFVLNNESIIKHKQTYTANLTLAYDDGLKTKAYICELYFEQPYFELTNENSEILSFKELDINGE